jgi:hypothetical protein
MLIATLKRLRLAASRFGQFAAFSGAPSHRPPKAQDYAIMADYIRDLRPAKWGSMINLRCNDRAGRALALPATDAAVLGAADN